jgi:hypothetical protein
MPLSRRAERSWLVASLFAAFVSTASTQVHAEPNGKAACITAFEDATQLRVARKLVEARRKLLECAGDGCPSDVQGECAKELGSLERSLPSVVLVARDQLGNDVFDGRAFVDGVAHSLDGRSVALDPGPHTIRFEGRSCNTTEERVLLAEGELNRAIIGSLRCGEDPSGAADTGNAEGTTAGARASLVWPAALGAVGVAGLAGFAILGTIGKNDIADIRATNCAPACDRAAVDRARTKLLIGDVLGLVGVVGLGAAAYLLLFPPPRSPAASPPRQTRLDVRPTTGGAALSMDVRF